MISSRIRRTISELDQCEGNNDLPSKIYIEGICSAMQEAKEYIIAASMQLDENRRATKILSCSCNCVAAVNPNASAHCKQVLRLVYAMSAVVDSGVIPGWPVCSASLEQTWGHWTRMIKSRGLTA